MHLDFEKMQNCGAECNRTDGCIGFDEAWVFQAHGDLAPGESFTYTPPEPMCHARSKIMAFSYGDKGKSRLSVTLEVWDTEHSWNAEGMEFACLIPSGGDGHGGKYWRVTITNTHHKKVVRGVWFYGSAQGTPWTSHYCPQGT